MQIGNDNFSLKIVSFQNLKVLSRSKICLSFVGLLAIEDRWKELGITLGYTRNEINHKFSPENPLDELLTDFMSRGGEASHLIRAMYEVARRLKLISYDPKVENRENRNMENRLQGTICN